MSIQTKPSAAELLLLYPSESLRRQVNEWGRAHSRRRIKASFERSLPGIRKLLRGAGAALVDATEDPARAADAFLQAEARLGSEAVAVYSEAAHEDLELFVRLHGPLYLLGPLFARQWSELFERLLHGVRRRSGACVDNHPCLPPSLWFERAARLRRRAECNQDPLDVRFGELN